MKMLLKNKGDRTIKIDELVSDMLGFNCADLSNIVNLAGIEAVKLKKEKISMKDLVEAKETVSLGRVRKTLTVIV
jgi:ATP-dependent 26S proteasome regulatory subunit